VRTLNFCEKCFEKQRELDRLKEEIERLRGELNRKQRKGRSIWFFNPFFQKALQAKYSGGGKKERGSTAGTQGIWANRIYSR
jgi:hypothetical protein